MKNKKIPKKIWLNKTTIDLIKQNSKLDGINHSEFVENCILEHFNKTSKLNKRQVKFNKSELQLLKLMYDNKHTPFSICVLEDMSGKHSMTFTRRCVRDIIKNFFNAGLLDKLESKRGKQYKCFNLSKKAIKLYENL